MFVFPLLEVPRSVFRRGQTIETGRLLGRYTMHSAKISPTSLGIPASRERRYTCFHLESTTKPAFEVDLETIFFKDVVVGGEVFLALSDEDRQRALADEPLSDGHVARWAKYESTLESVQIERSRPKTCACFVNLSTNVSFSGIPASHVVGTLVRNSRIVELHSGKEIAPAEYWMIQGYIPPCALQCSLPEEWRKVFPMDPVAFEKLRLTQTATLTGNGMHMSVVCAMLWFALMACQ
eukprot:6462235-Amphidinium_carterae.2